MLASSLHRAASQEHFTAACAQWPKNFCPGRQCPQPPGLYTLNSPKSRFPKWNTAQPAGRNCKRAREEEERPNRLGHGNCTLLLVHACTAKRLSSNRPLHAPGLHLAAFPRFDLSVECSAGATSAAPHRRLQRVDKDLPESVAQAQQPLLAALGHQPLHHLAGKQGGGPGK